MAVTKEKGDDMALIVGSARADENYKYSGGRRGDQRQTGKRDTSGEVSLQNFYVHPKGIYVLRPKLAKHANGIAKSVEDACNNKHIGYNQADRYSIIKQEYTKNKDIKVDVNCDCSSLVRKAIMDATRIDVGDFNTANEASVLESSSLFEPRKDYKNGMELYDGDILVTKTKGHTYTVVSGNPRKEEKKKSDKVSTGSEKPVKYVIGKKYSVKGSSLNMRKAPSGESAIVVALKKGEKLTCRQVKNVGKETWVSNGAGWVCAYSSGKVNLG